jgi:hypothetical protein
LKTIQQIEELPLGPNQVEIKLTREGVSGDATISWSLRGTGVNAAQVTADDVAQMDGTVIMSTGTLNKLYATV